MNKGHLSNDPMPVLENPKHAQNPLATAGGGWEKDLRISTPVLPSTQCGLKPLAKPTECFAQNDIPALEAQNKAAAPTAKQSQHFEIKNAETIEDNSNG